MGRRVITYVIARNRSKRPTLQHIINNDDPDFTLCGTSVWEWSRAYISNAIPEILCKRCRHLNGDD